MTMPNQPDPRGELLRRRLAGAAAGDRAGIPRVPRTGPLPLSDGQRQMWFLHRLDPDSTEYHLPLALRLRGPLDVAALGRAWAATIARHDILRTRYVVVDGVPAQVVDPPTGAGLPDGEPAGTPFDLAAEWPIRAGLRRLADDDHVLSLVVHHICWDAWSFGVLAADLAAAYRGEPLPAPDIQYADYAAWQRAQVTDRQLGYWRSRLDGIEPLDLPTDRPRPAVRGHAGAAASFVVPARTVARLDALGATPFVVLLTAFAVLLSRYTGRTDVPIGTVVSARTRPELEHLIGYGINTLVMRAVWDGPESFAELVRRVRATVLDAYDHQAAPFARLVDALQPGRDLSRTPLFQAAYTTHAGTGGLLRLPGVTAEPYGPGEPVAKWDLELQTRQDPDGTVHGRLIYPTALFDAPTVDRMARQLACLLDRAAADPAAPADAIDVLDEAERAVTLGAPAAPAPPVPARSVPEAFAARAAAAPDATAVLHGDARLSYAQLDARAEAVARRLRALGAGPQAPVAVLLERDLDLVPALLGVLRTGAGYLPLDPAHPVERLRRIAGGSGATVLVTAPTLRDTAARCHDGAVLVLGEDGAEAAGPPAAIDPDSLMYVIHTSGSTGRPKGVCVTHAAVHRLVRTAQEHLRAGPGDVWALCHSYAFDVSVFEIWGALLTGGAVSVVPQRTTRSPDDLLDLLIAHRVTVLSQTPSAFGGLVAAAGAGDPRVGRLPVRAVVLAGENLDVPSLRPWVARAGLERTALLNMYGITETTVHATVHRITAADLDPAAAGSPIGVPLPDLTIRLLDAGGRPVPIGVPGEIHVGGPGLARGYLGRPDLTAARFVPDPYGPPGSRMYRSGDLALRTADGRLRFLRRADDQVKIRGYRVEPGEIRAVLRAHPAVRDAVVVAADGRLLAYVVGDGVDGLRAHCAGLLPAYMVPAAIVPLEAFPLTANGKLDTGRLPAPDRGALTGPAGYAAPESAEQERMAAVWRAVLGVDRVGVQDGFFDLGGDSIRAVALIGRLREAGFDVTVRDVFAHRTVAALCALASGRRAPTVPVVAPFALIGAQDRRLLPDGLTDAYPMLRTQVGMVADMLAGHRPGNYHNVASARIRDGRPCDPDALRAAARLLVARHEALRTSFDLHTCAAPMQLVHAHAELPVDVRDLRGRDADAVRRALEEFHAAERARPFDLAAAPMMRLTAHLADDGWWLSITEFHAVVEGWSYHSLIRELLTCYRALRAGEQPRLDPLPAVRFADAVAGELRALASADDRAYWADVPPPVTLPAAWGAPGESESYWEHVPFADLVPGLRALAAAAGASLKSVIVAAHGAVLSRLTHRGEFSTGLVTHIRPEAAGAEQVLGMHLNTVPFAVPRGGRTWRELVAAVFARETAMWPHRFFPMPEMQRLAGGARPVDVLLNYVDFDELLPDGDTLDLASAMTPGTTEFDLAVTTVGGRVSLKSHTRVLARAHGRRLAGMYRSVLEAMAADPDGDAHPVFGPAAVAGHPVTAFPPRSVPETVADRAAGRPDAIAVECGDVRLSYRDLDGYADRVAARLRTLGVGPESVVAVCCPRGPGLVAALLGVWKAGGAYLPIDAATPAPRVEALIADSGAAVLVDTAFLAALPDGPAPAHRHVPDPDQLAYVIYTSGSTGRPKGVQVTHRGLAGHLHWAADALAGRGHDGAPLFSPVAFDLVVPNLWAPLMTGQRLWLWPDGEDLSALGDALSAAAPFSFVKLTPGHLELLLGRLGPRGTAALAPLLLVAGEALPGALAGRLAGLGAEIVNEYGPTETTVGATVHTVTGPVAGTVPIGRPLPNVTVHVLDAALRPVPAGVTGELYVGGTGVARGYLGRPDLTARRFVPGPGGSRLYRTGDLVSVDAHGALEFAGRVDDQVKIRGFRVEPAEVEAALRALPGVAEARVVAREGRLIGYVTGPADAGAAREALSRTVPDHLVPDVIVPLAAMPLTANGKLDRAALPAPAVPDRVAPRSPAEGRMAEVWRGALGVARVGVHDDFFSLGGDSIRAVAIVGPLRAAGFDVTVRDVFDRRTVAGLCALAESRPAAADDPPVAPFALIGADDRARLPGGLTDAYPMARTQAGMIAEMLADDTLHRYHSVTTFRIRDAVPFAVAALRAAARLVAGRHEALRTSFDLGGYTVPMQLVHAEAEIPVGVHEGTDLRAFQARERARPFDVSRPPLLRLAVHLAPGGGWWLTVVRCHAITEGWSFYNLLTELLDAYRAIRDGHRPAPPPRASVRYADFVARELRALASAEHRAHWTRTVAAHPRFALPAAWADPVSPRERYRLRVPFADLEDRLRALARDARASLKSVLLAAHLTVLGRLTPERSFLTGLVCDARPEAAGAEHVHGMYLNTVPFVHRHGTGSWRELVADVFAQEVAIWPHRHFPMPEMQRIAGGGRLVGVSFNYLDFDQLDAAQVDVGATLSDGNTEFDLAVTTLRGQVGISGHTRVLGRDRADRLAAMYRAVLEAMASGEPEVPLPPEDVAVLDALRRPAPPAPARSVPEAVAAVVADRPAAVAVRTGTSTLSYAELDRFAGRIAYRLRRAGAGPETVVAVRLERGPGLAAALLGVWKAGGAYLPIDPATPPGRARLLCADAGAAVEVDEAFLAGLGEEEWHGMPHPDQLAYVVYTSGSTGRPKGVQITHRGLANRVATGPLTARDRVLQKTSIGFDAAGWELFAPLVCGASVVMAPPGAERDPAALVRAVAEHDVTVLQVVPSVLRLLVETPGWRACTALRLLTVAGEPLDAELCQRFLDLRQARIWNTYGPTEAAIDVTAHRFTPRQVTGPVPIGRPLPGVSVHVLDAGRCPVPVGVPGELYVGGPGVARGYLGRPDLTARRFVPGPGGSRLYRTGDLVVVRADGTLEFAGRTDDQIKINGVRVEPGEVAAALCRLPSIAAAAVLPWQGRLAAYLVPAGPELPGDRTLRRELAGTLPDVMIPAAFVALPALPLTASGKLDRRALPEPRTAHAHAYVPPSTPAERALAEVCAGVLGRERIGAHDPVLAGADSLTLIRLIAAARRAGLPLTLRLLYEHDTLSDLAAALPPVPAPTAIPAPPSSPTSTRGRRMTPDVFDPAALTAAMARHDVPGVSVALLRGGEVAHLAGYGVTAADRPEPVTARTPFQVASISKHVTMLGVLRLVADGVLNLDADINRYLTSWQVPGGAVITLRELVSHQAGLSHVPATNYLPGEPMPSIVQLLTADPPVRAVHRAGDVFKKTNINYSVLEQLLTDVTGERFGALLQRLVLDPLEMTDSTFDQDRPHRPAPPVAVGHDERGTPIPGRWRVRNEVAAGGLWSSARDLTRVAIAIRRSVRGEPDAPLPRPLAQQMITVWHPGSFYGLGTVVDPSSGDVEYGHGGRTVGFRCVSVTLAGSGDGLIVLANGENGKRAQTALVESLRRTDASVGTSPSGRAWAEAPDEPVEAVR